MARPALSAHVFVACRNVVWDGTAGPKTSRTLEQVGYAYRTELPDGFPYETEIWLFARLVHNRRREFSRELRISMIWHDDPELRPEVWNRPFQLAAFRPEVSVRDVAISVSTTFEGSGRYEFRLWTPVVRKWDQSRRRRTLARTYIRIEG